MARLYVPLNVTYPNDPKMLDAGLLPELLYIRAICWCRENLTDGWIDRRMLPVIARGFTKTERHARTLVKVGLWEERSDGYAIPLEVWRRWNPTADEVRAQREIDAERKRVTRQRLPRQCPPGHRAGLHPDVQPESATPEPEPEPEPEIAIRAAAALSRTAGRRQAAAAADPISIIETITETLARHPSNGTGAA